uniref:tubulin-glutamate carboxypeptidase n=1 Tax=Mastacembelus armatus TaxID=205130 RepID=A0A7N9ATV3_9TELE
MTGLCSGCTLNCHFFPVLSFISQCCFPLCQYVFILCILSSFVLFLQNAGDVESTINILNVLDELLSAGTDHRIHYMISKGGSEALLNALVNTSHSCSPNYSVLLPLLHLLAKVGHRDRRIGLKAEQAGAVLLTLNLLKQNVQHSRRAAACLWVIQVFSSSVSTANLIGENHGLDVIFHLIPQYTTKHLHTIKYVYPEANICSVVSKGYTTGLLRLYEDWCSKDTQHSNIAIAVCHTLLHCLHKVTNITAGRQAFISQGGIRMLYQTTQTRLMSKGLESLVERSVQLMRKCLPKTTLPLTSDQSAYTFPLPGRPDACPNVGMAPDECSEESDEEEAESNQEDEDLETDPNKLRLRPEPDRPKEVLPQYASLCPELSHDFKLDLSSGTEESSSSSSSSDEEAVSFNSCSPCSSRRDRSRRASSGQRGHEQDDEEKGTEESYQHTTIDRLLEVHRACIPHHEPKLYRTMAARTKSIPGFNIVAFPDFWGHLPPPEHEPMAPRKPNIQRQKVFEDIQRFLNTDDLINQVVFDLEDNSFQPPADSLWFFSKFESGNLRKAVQVRRYEYDLILNADANCFQHSQWFYFEVSNMEADVPYRFNIINCEKSNSQFNYGMQPVLYSVREALEGRPHWVRTGTEICYFRNHFCPVQGRRRTTFYTLTFTINFKHNEDVCYLAYHYPYTYSALKAHLNILEKSVDPAKVFFQQQSLCATLAGNSCPVVTITACPASRSWKDVHELRNRSYIVLTGRVHPGESNASWVMKGTLEFLCSDDPVAQSLRETFIFKIIPMLNPDGVINGTNRCDLNSEDLNRQWCKPNSILSPTIYHTKGLLYYLNSIGQTPLVFCDYHGHSRKKNVFLYGCSVKETLWQSGSPVDTVGLKEDPGYRTIPKTLDRIAPAFSFNSCNYLVEKSRSATARVVVWREIGVLRSYTMESTYNGCDQGIYKGLQTGTRELQEMGMKFCHSLLCVTKDMNGFYIRRLIHHVDPDHNSYNCFEDDEPPCVEEIEYSTDWPTHKGSELDSDVNSNMACADEEDGGRKEYGGPSNIKSCLYPHLIRQASMEMCNGMSISFLYSNSICLNSVQIPINRLYNVLQSLLYVS